MSTQPQSFIRAYPTAFALDAARHELSGRLVPYDLAADVVDELPDGRLDIYREGFRRGAFAPQAMAKGKGVINKINLVHRHGPGGLGYLGVFTALRDDEDGLYGDVRIMPTKADDVEALLDAGVDELSVEFRLARAEHTVEVDGVRWRTRAHLDQVALEPKGAYSTARVLAYRAELDDEQKAREAEQAAAEAVAAEERKAAEVAAADEAEAERRRAEWEQLSARLDTEVEKQQQLVREYGVTQPGAGRGTDSRLSMPPGKVNLAIYQGDDYALVATFRRPPVPPATVGVPLDLTGHTFKAQIRESTADADEPPPPKDPYGEFVCTVTDAPGGVLTLTLDHTITVQFKQRTGQWDLQGTDPAGIVTTYLAGTVTLTLEVTR